MIKRIEHIAHKFGLNPSKFADEIGVQRSAISHILSGRNRPSLDLIQKILTRWPEVNPGWLITGKGNSDHSTSEVKAESIPLESNKPLISQKVKQETSSQKNISHIVIFYSDGTFERYQNAQI